MENFQSLQIPFRFFKSFDPLLALLVRNMQDVYQVELEQFKGEGTDIIIQPKQTSKDMVAKIKKGKFLKKPPPLSTWHLMKWCQWLNLRERNRSHPVEGEWEFSTIRCWVIWYRQYVVMILIVAIYTNR